MNTREISDRVRATRAGVEALRATSIEERARLLTQTLSDFAKPESASGKAARSILPTTTGLSPEMVDWGLSAIAVDESELIAMVREGERVDIASVVLAGNVFVACVEPIFAALMLGVPVIAKASSRDDGFPRLLRAALRTHAPNIAGAFDVLTYPGAERELNGALFSEVDVAIAYGSDHTLASIKEQLPPSCSLVEHGHGLGAVFVSERVQEDLERTASAIAIDVCAYDQRGCMSPHAVFVDGDISRTQDFARALARAMDRFGARYPRGPIPPEVASQQLQWRAVGATRGELHEGGQGFSVTREDGPFRLSPGYRNVAVIHCRADQLNAALDPIARYLRVLAVDDPSCPPYSANTLRICGFGAMQRPRFGETRDGLAIDAGLIRDRASVS